MGVASFLIGILPTYASIGARAPAALVSLRFLQSFALGGEVTVGSWLHLPTVLRLLCAVQMHAGLQPLSPPRTFRHTRADQTGR
jgi:hypothetical protein